MIFVFLLSGIFITESDFELLMRLIVPGVVENNNICQSKINELDQRTPEAEEYNNWVLSRSSQSAQWNLKTFVQKVMRSETMNSIRQLVCLYFSDLILVLGTLVKWRIIKDQFQKIFKFRTSSMNSLHFIWIKETKKKLKYISHRTYYPFHLTCGGRNPLEQCLSQAKLNTITHR